MKTLPYGILLHIITPGLVFANQPGRSMIPLSATLLLYRENPHCSRRKKENIRQQPIYQSIANHNLKACTNKTHAVLYDTEIIPKKLFRAVSISKNTLQNDRKRGKQCV